MSQDRGKVTRRTFLATSAAGLAAAGLGALPSGRVLAGEEAPEATPKEMAVRTLGRTGIKVPVVSQGVGGCQDPSMVAASYEAGIRHFDTAAGYAFGANEQMLGDVIRRLNVREHVTIATKIFQPAQRRAGESAESLKQKLLRATDASLKRLRSDYVDVMYIHDVGRAEDISDQAVVEAYRAIKASGKAKAIGVSTHSNMAAVLNEAARSGHWDVVLTAINFSMAEDVEFMKALATAGKAGIGIVGMKTMAGGSRWPNPETRRSFAAEVVATAAIKWVLSNEQVATIIPGYSSQQELNLDLAAGSNLQYTDEERRFLSDNAVKLGMGFCRQCRHCLASCPHGVDIPTLVRTHMYLVQYGNIQLARAALDEITEGSGLSQCASCRTCVARCANTVDIDRRLGELKLIMV